MRSSVGRIESPTSLAASAWSILANIFIPFERSSSISLSIVLSTEWLLGKSVVPFAGIKESFYVAIWIVHAKGATPSVPIRNHYRSLDLNLEGARSLGASERSITQRYAEVHK